MNFENGRPTEKVVDEVGFSVYAAIIYLANTLSVNPKTLLNCFRTVNELFATVINSLFLSGILLDQTKVSGNKGVLTVFNFLLAYMFFKIVELVSKKVYKPRFFNQSTMKLSDVVDKISGPNKNWDIVSAENYKLRSEIEYELTSVKITTVISFVVSLGIAVLTTKLSMHYSGIPLVVKGAKAFFLYCFIIFFFIHFGYSYKKSKRNTIIYGLLLLLFCSLFGYSLIL